MEIQELVDLCLTHWDMELFSTFQTYATFQILKYSVENNILLQLKINDQGRAYSSTYF